MKKIANKISLLGGAREYEKAYLLGKQALKNEGDPKFVIQALKNTAKNLRRSCVGLANNKATEFSKELKEKTALLKKYNSLTNQDMYGRNL